MGVDCIGSEKYLIQRREPGFYYVKRTSADSWEPCLYVREKKIWLLVGIDTEFEESIFHAIGGCVKIPGSKVCFDTC